jgi:hypothetical protein
MADGGVAEGRPTSMASLPVQDLLRSLKATAGARFNAGKRLELLDRRLTMVTATSTAYVIILTVLPYFMPISKQAADAINLFTVGLSIIVLVSTLIQYSSSNTVRAEQHHRSALEINEIRRELKLKEKSISDPDFLALSQRYNAVLHKYSINHDDIDFYRYQLDRPEEFPWLGRLDRFKMRLIIVPAVYFPHAVLIITTLLVSYIIFGFALPARAT